MRRAFKIICSPMFSTKGQLSTAAWTKRNIAVCLHFWIALPTGTAFLTWKQISFPVTCSAQNKPKPSAHFIALDRSDVQGETSCSSWFSLLRLHIPSSFSSHGTQSLALLVTLTVLSTRCCETCHTPGWDRKAQCPQHIICWSNCTAHTKRKGG